MAGGGGGGGGKWEGPAARAAKKQRQAEGAAAAPPSGGSSGPYDAREWEFFCDACAYTIERGEVRCVRFVYFPAFFFPWVGGVGVVPFFNAFLFSWVGVGGWGVVVVLFFMGDGVGGCRWCPCLIRPISTHAHTHTHTHTTRLQQLRVPPLPRRILPLPALLPQPSDRAHPPPPLPAQHGPLPRHRAAPLAAAGAAAAAAAGGRGGG